MERCLAGEADTVGTPGGEPLWQACNDLPHYFYHLCNLNMWQQAAPGNDPARPYAQRFY